MTEFWIGLSVGTAFGLAIAIILSRLAGSVRVVGRLFGFSDDRRKVSQLTRRLEEKDRYIKKAIESFQKEGRAAPPPPEDAL